MSQQVPATLPEKLLNEINAETRWAIENARKGIGLSRGFSSVAELMEDLNADRFNIRPLFDIKTNMNTSV